MVYRSIIGMGIAVLVIALFVWRILIEEKMLHEEFVEEWEFPEMWDRFDGSVLDH